MKRRTFLKSSLAAASLAGIAPNLATPTRAAENDGGKNQYYELRVYSLSPKKEKREEQQKLIADYWRDAAIPALNRLGVKPVGAFVELDKPESAKLWVLLPYDSLEVFASVPARLAADAEYQRAGAPYLEAPESGPAYDRFASNLLIAFDGMKKLAVPGPADQPRVFELRSYESRGEGMAMNKVVMFNSGEIPTMREVNLGPVFFAESLVGDGMPRLTYMVSSENMDEHKKHWAGFFSAPTWNKLKGDPQYKGNVSKVISTFLQRASYSQI